MGVELIESDDDGIDMGPSKTNLVECRVSDSIRSGVYMVIYWGKWANVPIQ